MEKILNKKQLDFKDYIVRESTNEKDFLQKFTLILGNTKTGKSVIVRDILTKLYNVTPNIIIFTPTAKEYDELFANCQIKTSVTQENIENILLRQKEVKEIYEKVHSKTFLSDLLKQAVLPIVCNDIKLVNNLYENLEKGLKKIEDKDKKINTLRAAIKKFIGDNSEKRNSFLEKYSKYLSDLNKEQFNIHRNKNYANYIIAFDINPNIVIVFDDLTEKIPDMLRMQSNVEDPNEPKSPVFMKLTTKCRHYFMTVILVAHGVNSVKKDIRAQIKNIISTDNAQMIDYLDKDAKHLSKFYLNNLSSFYNTPLIKSDGTPSEIKPIKVYYNSDSIPVNNKNTCFNFYIADTSKIPDKFENKIGEQVDEFLSESNNNSFNDY